MNSQPCLAAYLLKRSSFEPEAKIQCAVEYRLWGSSTQTPKLEEACQSRIALAETQTSRKQSNENFLLLLFQDCSARLGRILLSRLPLDNSLKRMPVAGSKGSVRQLVQISLAAGFQGRVGSGAFPFDPRSETWGPHFFSEER